MEVSVKVSVELGEGTKAFINGLIAANGGNTSEGAAKAAPAKEAKAPKAEAPAKDEAPAKEEVTEAPARGRRRAAAKAEDEAPAKAPAKEAVKEAEAAPARRRRAAAKEEAPAADDVAFEDLSTDDQLADLQKRITKHTKKGKTADIKELLSVFDAGRASELDAKDYVEFSDALARYDAGETVDEIFPQLD